MDITNATGEVTYFNTSINFNITMEEVLLNPELWDKPFELTVEKRVSGSGNPYMSVTIQSAVPIEA